jgi:hypothetical protein
MGDSKAAIFSWTVPPGFVFGDWTLQLSDDTGWTSSLQFNMSSSEPQTTVHCSNTSPTCITGGLSLAKYP